MNKKLAVSMTVGILALAASSGFNPAAAAGAPPSANVQPAVRASEAYSTQLIDAADTLGLSRRLASWWSDGHTLHVGLTRLVPGDQARLTQALGLTVSLELVEPVSTAVKRTYVARGGHSVRIAHAGRGQSAQPHATAAAPSTDPRLIDASPYYAGDRIASVQGSYIYECTAGGKYLAGSSPDMATAGHCGPKGTVWYQGYYDASANTLWNSGVMGTASTVSWGNSGIDGALLNGNAYKPNVWTSSSTSAHITGAGAVGMGTSVCADGSVTFLSCGGVVDAVNICVIYSDPTGNKTACGLDRAHSTYRLDNHGDSGGPVLTNLSGSSAQLAGIISGESDSTGTTMYFTPTNQLTGNFKVTVATS